MAEAVRGAWIGTWLNVFSTGKKMPQSLLHVSCGRHRTSSSGPINHPRAVAYGISQVTTRIIKMCRESPKAFPHQKKQNLQIVLSQKWENYSYPPTPQ